NSLGLSPILCVPNSLQFSLEDEISGEAQSVSAGIDTPKKAVVFSVHCCTMPRCSTPPFNP
ncbi:MAG: hypothetical protein KDI08_09200, partial [Pseudomonadales bacterium]|nr:hypothetical protein [Pseudomonadales bacterium]